MNFSNRHVVVTGGTGALGAAVVASLLERGAHCHVPYRSQAEAERYVHRGHRAVTLYGNVALGDEAAVTAFFAKIPDIWASIHLAGGFAAAPIGKTAAAAFSGQIETNLLSCFLCCREAVKAMAGKSGRIVNVAARPALEPRSGANMAAYTAAKAGVAALTMALAEEVAAQGILVNAVAPSIMDTLANRQAIPKADFAKWPKVDEVAATILFLASPENTVTLGAIVPVYGKS
jgi:NAD(P)-dependent dehydrogenase (short-subunit alcohol dehydrogenase family)